jgi:hypothetical protein
LLFDDKITLLRRGRKLGIGLSDYESRVLDRMDSLITAGEAESSFAEHRDDYRECCGESTLPSDHDVLLGPGVQNRNEGSRCFHDFVEKFFPEYEDDRGFQQLSLAREVLDKWRIEHPCRFFARSCGGYEVVAEDKGILSNILRRWLVVKAERGGAEICEDNALKKLNSKSPPERPSGGGGTALESSSIVVKLGAIRTAVGQDVPLPPREQCFYNDAVAAGLTRCDPTELGVCERLALFSLSRRHDLELSQREAKLLDRMTD